MQDANSKFNACRYSTITLREVYLPPIIVSANKTDFNPEDLMTETKELNFRLDFQPFVFLIVAVHSCHSLREELLSEQLIVRLLYRCLWDLF